MTRRGFVPYGPSGAAVEALSRVMAADLADTPVTVNLLLPGGATATGMVPEDTPPEVRERLLDPAVMGPPIVWLASDACRRRARPTDRGHRVRRALNLRPRSAGEIGHRCVTCPRCCLFGPSAWSRTSARELVADPGRPRTDPDLSRRLHAALVADAAAASKHAGERPCAT